MNSVYILYIGRPMQFLLIWFGVWSFLPQEEWRLKTCSQTDGF